MNGRFLFVFEALPIALQTKQKPGPLELALLFKEVIRVKRAAGNSSSVRELLFSSVAEYNKSCSSNKVQCC